MGRIATAIRVSPRRSLTRRRLSRPSRIGSRAVSCAWGSGCNATSKRWCVAMTPHAREAGTYPFVPRPPRTSGVPVVTGSACDGLPRLDAVDAHLAQRAPRELVPELLRCPGEDRERAVVDRQDLGDAE